MGINVFRLGESFSDHAYIYCCPGLGFSTPLPNQNLRKKLEYRKFIVESDPKEQERGLGMCKMKMIKK